jgi:hypothetical protein
MADDTGDGTTYETAKQLLASGLGLLTDPGDILNVVADGTHTWPNTSTVLNATLTGTSYTDFGAKIRGVDGAGANAAMVTVTPGGTGARGLFTIGNGVKYIILENFIFDSSATPTDAGTQRAVYMNTALGTGGPVKIRYCAMIGGLTGVVSTGKRELFESNVGSGDATFYVEYCYFQNCKSPMGTNASYGGTQLVIKMDHCVGIWDATNRTVNWLNVGTWSTDDSNDVTFTYNTFYESVGDNALIDITNYAPNAAISIGNANFHSNLCWINASGTQPLAQFMEGGTNGDATTIYSGFIGTNVLLGGPDIASTDIGVGGWYKGAWDSGSDPQTTDTEAFEVADTTVFNDPASTYAWEMPNCPMG